MLDGGEGEVVPIPPMPCTGLCPIQPPVQPGTAPYSAWYHRGAPEKVVDGMETHHRSYRQSTHIL